MSATRRVALSGPEEAIVNLIKLLRGAPGGGSVEIIPHDSSFYQLKASDSILDSDDTTNTITDLAPTKYHEFLILRSGTIRTKFSLKKTATADPGRGQIYINSVAAGTARANNTSSWIEYTEDFIIRAGDLLQLYLWVDGGTEQQKNMRLYATKTLQFTEETL